MYIIEQLEIDFSLVVLLAGEDYFNSESYVYEGDSCEENQLDILIYLISENYSKVIEIIVNFYSNNQKLLFLIIEPYCEHYLETVEKIQTLEDVSTYPYIVRLHSWAEDGFDLNGDMY